MNFSLRIYPFKGSTTSRVWANGLCTSPLQYILNDWDSKLYEKPSIVLPVLSKNIEELKQGLRWYRASASNSPSEVSIDGQIIKINAREKDVIARLSKCLPIDKPACHALFKLFVASKSCHKDWKAYLVSTGPVNPTTEKRIVTKFIRFYFDERVASLELLFIVLDCNRDASHPCHLACSDLVPEIYSQPSELLEKLFDQLLEEVTEPAHNKLFAFQQFREQRALLTLVLFLMEHEVSLGEARTSKFFGWLFSQKQNRDLQSLHAATNYQRLHADRLKLVLLYRLLRVDSFDDPDHMIHATPKVLSDLVRSALLAPPSPESVMYSMALALMAKAALVYHNNLPPQRPDSKLLYDMLVDPNRALGATFNHTLYPHIDADLAVVFYRRAYGLDFWKLFERLFSSQACPRGSETPRICQDVLSFVCSMGYLFPDETLISADNYMVCVTGLLRGNDALCAYFWRAQRASRRFRALLDFARARYPATPHLLPGLLGALTGAHQAQKVATYFSSLVSLTQAYSPLVSQSVDSVLDPTCDLSILEATSPIQLQPSPRKTVFAIPPLTRGVLSEHSTGEKLVIWSVVYSGWDLLLSLLDNLLCEDDPLDPTHSDTLLSVQCALQLLKDVLRTSPGTIRHLFSSQPVHYNEASDLRLVYQLIDLCDVCICSRDPPKRVFATVLSLLSLLFPLYPVVIGNFLSRTRLFFSGASLDCSTLAQVILCNKSRPDVFPVIEACLELSIGCTSFLLDKLSFQQQPCHRTESIPQFALAALRMTLVDVYPHYLSWNYPTESQKYQIGIHCLDLFIIATEASDSDLPVLQDMINLVTESFFQQENGYMLKPLIHAITLGRSLLHRHELLGQKLEASLMAEHIHKALQLLALLLKKRFVFANHPGLASHWVMGMLQDRNGYSCDFVYHIIKLVTASNSQLIAQSATEVISLLVALGSTNQVASQKLGLTFSSLTQEFGEEVRNILMGDSVLDSLQQNTWNLLSCLANAHSHYLAGLLGMADSTSNSLLLGVIKNSLEDSLGLARKATPADGSFFCFLKHLWKNHAVYKTLPETIAQPLRLWELLKNILELECGSNPHLASIHENIYELVGYEIDRLASAEIQMGSSQFLDLVKSICRRLPTLLRKGLELKPRPISLQLLNRATMAINISIASMEASVTACGLKDFGMYSPANLGIDAAKIIRAVDLMHYGQESPIPNNLLWYIERANHDIISAHIHRQLFHEQTKLVQKMFSCPIEIAFKDLPAMIEGLCGLLRALVELQETFTPSGNNLIGIANLSQLMSQVSAIIYEMREHFGSVSSAKLLLQFFEALLECQAWVRYDSDYEASSVRVIHHLKVGWYQATSGALMAIESVKSFWLDDAECKASFHLGFERAVEMAAEELLNCMPSSETPTLSVSAKIIGMLLSLFQVDELPSSQAWARALLINNIPDTLLQMFVRFATIDQLDAQLFSHKIAHLLVHLCASSSIGDALVESQAIAKITALVAQLQLSRHILELESPCAVVQAHVFMACLDLCTQLYKSADMSHEDNFEVATQTDELLATISPFISELLRSVWYSVQMGFTHLRCVGAAVRFITSLDPNTLPALACSHWRSLAEQLSPLMSCLIDTLLLPGALAKRIADPSALEAQLARRFALAKVTTDSLARLFMDGINFQLLDFFNAHWQSLQILNFNPAQDTHDLMLLVNSYNKFGQPLSFGTLLECISIYTPALSWLTQSMEQYFPPSNSKKVPFELITRANTAAAIISQALILLLAQTHLLLVSGDCATEIKSHLLYDLQQEISPQFQAVLPLLKKLLAWFPRRNATERQPFPRSLENLTFYWKKAHQHILTGSYHRLNM